MKPNDTKHTKIILGISAFLILIVIFCLLWITSSGNPSGSADGAIKITAEIYQNGELTQSISLSEVTESYTFVVHGENGCENEIEVRPGSIGIISASCPDKVCVNQGFVDNSLLPIVCLPNNVVIQVYEENEIEFDIGTPDVTSY